jgi:hypothetical protein
VEIANPHQPPNITTRFDRAGFITEVTLDGVHRFCASEPNNLSHPSSGGRGICNEFVFDISKEVAVGEYFPKLGVGLLQKNEEAPYHLSKKYEVKPFTVHVDASENQAVFTTEPAECHGYGVKQIKTVAVHNNELSVTVHVTNTGQHPIEGGEYCHNFLTINGMAIGPDYSVEFEDVKNLSLENVSGVMTCRDKTVTFTRYDREAAQAFVPMDSIIRRDAFRWTLRNPSGGAYIKAREEIDICRLVLWAADHMVSVESFHKLSLQPGASGQWTRRWVFKSC